MTYRHRRLRPIRPVIISLPNRYTRDDIKAIADAWIRAKRSGVVMVAPDIEVYDVVCRGPLILYGDGAR